jgi:hypothetical protein
MKDKLKQLLFLLLYVVVFYLTLLYTKWIYTEFFISKFSKIRYNDDVTMNPSSANNFVLLGCCFLSFFLNRQALKILGKHSLVAWLLYGLIDFLLIPFSVLLMVLYNNTKLGIVNLSSVENMFLMLTLLVSKQLLVLMYYKKAFIRN